MKKILFILIALVLLLSACTDADIVSQRLSKDADMFRIQRRIVFYNGITGEYILVIEGMCSLGNYDSAGELSVTCRTGEEQYKKHFLGLSDNVTYFSEQVESAYADPYHYKVIFKPQAIIPDIELEIDN